MSKSEKNLLFSFFSHDYNKKRQSFFFIDLIFFFLFCFSGGRAVGTIIGVISALSLFLVLVACCIVYYRRYLQRKG
jgi:hypothetical protein